MDRLSKSILLCVVMIGLFIGSSWADTTSNGATTNAQTNTSGSNTTISGGYSQESTTTYQSGSSSSTTSTTNNSTNNTSSLKDQQNTASAPSMSAMSQDVCAVGISGGLQYPGIGMSFGKHMIDENCERIKLSKVLNDLGMKVAAVSILCQDPRVFFAMEQSGTPCPFQGKIGVAAAEEWKKYDKLRPDFDVYTERLALIQNRNKEDEDKTAEEKSLQMQLDETTVILNAIKKENEKIENYTKNIEKQLEKEKKKNKKKEKKTKVEFDTKGTEKNNKGK